MSIDRTGEVYTNWTGTDVKSIEVWVKPSPPEEGSRKKTMGKDPKSSRPLLTPARQEALARMLNGVSPVRISPEMRP